MYMTRHAILPLIDGASSSRRPFKFELHGRIDHATRKAHRHLGPSIPPGSRSAAACSSSPSTRRAAAGRCPHGALDRPGSPGSQQTDARARSRSTATKRCSGPGNPGDARDGVPAGSRRVRWSRACAPRGRPRGTASGRSSWSRIVARRGPPTPSESRPSAPAGPTSSSPPVSGPPPSPPVPKATSAGRARRKGSSTASSPTGETMLLRGLERPGPSRSTRVAGPSTSGSPRPGPRCRVRRRDGMGALNLRGTRPAGDREGGPDPAGLAAAEGGRSTGPARAAASSWKPPSPARTTTRATIRRSADLGSAPPFPARKRTPPVDTLASGRAKFILKERRSDDDGEEDGSASTAGRNNSRRRDDTPYLKYEIRRGPVSPASRAPTSTFARSVGPAPSSPLTVPARGRARSARSSSWKGRIRPSTLHRALRGRLEGFRRGPSRREPLRERRTTSAPSGRTRSGARFRTRSPRRPAAEGTIALAGGERHDQRRRGRCYLAGTAQPERRPRHGPLGLRRRQRLACSSSRGTTPTRMPGPRRVRSRHGHHEPLRPDARHPDHDGSLPAGAHTPERH